MDVAPPLVFEPVYLRTVQGAKPPRGSASRSDTFYSLGAIAGVSLPVGVGATRFAQDVLLGIAAAGMVALLLVALLNALGILGGR